MNNRRFLLFSIVSVLASACGSGHQVQEPPVRILDLARPVTVILVSSEDDLEVFEIHPDGTPGDRLGSPPLVVDRITIDKEIWKAGSTELPATGADLQLTAVQSDEVTQSEEFGAPLRWSFLVSNGGEPPHRVDFELHPRGLGRAFQTGKLELSMDTVR